VAAPFDSLRRLFAPPADRRLAAALATAELEPAAPSMPPRVALVSGNDGGQRRRIFVDEQRKGIRTPWVPVGLHWRFEDMETVWQNAEIGNLDPLARMVEAMRSEGVTAGLMSVRNGFIDRPLTFQGDPWLCGLLRGEPPTFEGPNGTGRMVSQGKRGLFRRMFPKSALRDLAFTAELAGAACAELVDDPVTKIPVMQTRDLHRLRYDWGERAWKYRGQKDEYLVEPGNGRWILFLPKSTHRPWRSGAWLPLALAFIVMITTTYDAARFQAKNSDPLKYIDVPDEVPPDEVDRYEEFVQLWWERAPGIVLRYGAKAGLVETQGRGFEIYREQREWAMQQINFTLRGSMGTAGDNEGIFSDPTEALDVADHLIQSTADELAECIAEQGIGPTFERFGFVRHRDEAPTCSWDTRSPARKLAEAKSAGEVCDVITKLDTIGAARGKRVNDEAYFAQCGLTIPWVITTAAVDAVFEANPMPEQQTERLLPEPSTTDPVLEQTSPAGSLE
jgi:hypothetical protein